MGCMSSVEEGAPARDKYGIGATGGQGALETDAGQPAEVEDHDKEVVAGPRGAEEMSEEPAPPPPEDEAVAALRRYGGEARTGRRGGGAVYMPSTAATIQAGSMMTREDGADDDDDDDTLARDLGLEDTLPVAVPHPSTARPRHGEEEDDDDSF